MEIIVKTDGDKMSIIDTDIVQSNEKILLVLAHAVGLMLTRVDNKLTMYEEAQEAISRYIDMGDFLYNLPEESLN